MSRLLAGLGVLMALSLLAPAAVEGHAFMSIPKSRNFVDPNQFCPHCGQGGGTTEVMARIQDLGGNPPAWASFPDSTNWENTHGLCGDPFQNAGAFRPIASQPYMKETPIQATYTEGGIVEIEIAMSTNHLGFFEFRICEDGLNENTASQVVGQACLDKHLLQRVKPEDNPDCAGGESVLTNPDCQPIDPMYPARWWLPPDALGSPSGVHESVSATFKMKYYIPWGLSCTKCTMQWWWMSANSCHPDGQSEFYTLLRSQFPEVIGSAWDQGYNPAQFGMQKCGSTSTAQSEQFWNCADIAVLPADGTPPPTPEPTPPQTSPPSAPAPPNPCPEIISEWGACTATKGYTDFNGCCAAGLACFNDNPWYSQCRTAPAPAPSPPAPTPAPPAPTPAPPAPTPAPPSSTPSPPTSTPAPPAPAPSPPAPTPTPPSPPPPTSPDVPPPALPSPPPSTPTPPQAPAPGCFEAQPLGLYGNCTGQHSGCCGSGLACFKQDENFAQCRLPGTCPECSWDCTVIADKCTNPAPKYGNCVADHCCEEGLVCYEQDSGYAQCLPKGACPLCNTWSCNILIPGISGGVNQAGYRRQLSAQPNAARQATGHDATSRSADTEGPEERYLKHLESRALVAGLIGCFLVVTATVVSFKLKARRLRRAQADQLLSISSQE